MMRIYGNDVFSGVFVEDGVWKSSGSLVFTVANATNHSQEYSVSFDIINPSTDGAGASPRLLRDAAALTIVADQVCLLPAVYAVTWIWNPR